MAEIFGKAVTTLVFGLAVLVMLPGAGAAGRSHLVQMDGFTVARVEDILQQQDRFHGLGSRGDRAAQVSAAFLETPYLANMLIGSPVQPEVLVANFHQVDCFTLLDYVEALMRTDEHGSFLENLAAVRYVGGDVDYLSRRHFFSDWFAVQPGNAKDVTQDVGQGYVTVEKTLNGKPGGGEYVPGLGTVRRQISYIPAPSIDEAVIARLQTGDYVGVYSPLAGLDVTHVGIVVKNDKGVWFRNASSQAGSMKVVDAPFMAYMASKPGMIVLRTE